jgi:hypothetical protein
MAGSLWGVAYRTADSCNGLLGRTVLIGEVSHRAGEARCELRPCGVFVVLENTNMKKIGLMVVAVSLSLSLAAFAGNKSASTTQTPSTQSQPEAKAKGRGKALETPATLEKELAQLKQEQKATVDELAAIKTLATKEKATETTAALDKLIARHNKEFQTKIEAKQKQLDAMKQATEAQKGATDKAVKKGTRKTKTN